MMKLNKINFGLLMLLFLCRFENILGASDKNIEEGLKEKYKIVDLDGNILKNEKNEDFSFIITCECAGNYYKYSKTIEDNIENIKKKENLQEQGDMVQNFKDNNSKLSIGDIVKTEDGRVLVVKDSEIKDKVYLVLGIYDDNNSTTAIFLDSKYKLQTSGPYEIEENNTIRMMMDKDSNCGGVEIKEQKDFYKFQIVCCKLEKEDNSVENSGCCGCLGNCFKNLCP